MKFSFYLALRLAVLCAGLHPVYADFPEMWMKPIVLQQFHSPTCIVAAPGDESRLYVCDQPGKIYIVEGGMMRPEPFLDLTLGGLNAKVLFHNVSGQTPAQSPLSYSERGLLALAFHPGYADAESPGYRKFYLNYTKPYQTGIDPPPHDGGSWTPNCTTVIAEFTAVDALHADASTERMLLLYPQPQANHNGGNLVFDAQGCLYIGSGDGGGSNDLGNGHTGISGTSALGNGQDKTVLLGKILRIDPFGTNGTGGQYGIPADNPFVGAGGGVREEIYAYGIRNPWGLAFEDGPGGSGRLFCADVGQGRIEEVNLIVKGGNYGWRYIEGDERPTFSDTMAHPGGTLIGPIAMYGHPGISNTPLPLLGLSITGGYVYRGAALPELRGKYVFGDYGATGGAPSGRLMGLEETAPGSGNFTLTEALPILGGNPLSTRVMCLGEDAHGELYIGTKSSGGVMALENGLPNGGLYKLMPVPENPPPLVLTPSQDATIFSETAAMGEPLGNGSGPLWMGKNEAGALRRALLKFDLTSLPTHAYFASAWLRIHIGSALPGGGARQTFVNALLAPWGEATSFSATGGVPALEGDATWQHAFFSTTSPVPWAEPGGDISEAISASYGIDARTGMRGFFGPQLNADVNHWVREPAQNFGWMLRSDESVNAALKTLSSREDAEASRRPQLTLVQAGPFETWLASHFPDHLTGQWLDPAGDLDGDGIRNQMEYAYGLNPRSFDTVKVLTTQVSPAPSGGKKVTMTFRRDSAATDLVYRLEKSADLTSWEALARSVSGEATTVENGAVLEGEAALPSSVFEVNVSLVLAEEDGVKQFLRLVVERQP